PSEFARSEQVKVRHIVIGSNLGPRHKTKEQAMELIQQISGELTQKNAFPPGIDPTGAARVRLSNFAEEARKYSEDGSGQQGGDLGWNGRGVFDPTFEEAAFNMRPGVVSGIVETRFGYHLIFVEDRKPAGTAPFDEVKDDIRESL